MTDRTGENLVGLVESLGFGDGEVAVHVVIAGAEIRELRVASPEVPSCRELLPDVELRASGNEPFWAVDIEGAGAIFRSPEELDGVRYRAGEWEERPGGWRFEARPAAEEGPRLTLEVEPARCRDTMSGAWFPFTASLQERGSAYTGCAREGRR